MDRNEKELEDLAEYGTGLIVGNYWKILDLLDEGGFGKVYRVQDIRKQSLFAALKLESNNMEGGSAIKLEKTALERIHRNGVRSHVPMLYRSSKRNNVCYMIVTLLGENLKKIKDRFYPSGYPLKVWVKLSIQCLYAVKVVHDAGFIHRDIKSANFVLGHADNPSKARVVHIIDFGLARQYIYDDPKRRGTYKPRPARPRTDFRGTWSFASPSMHDYVELGRKDDIWSLLFMLIDMYTILPWIHLEDLEQIGTMKQNMKDEDLLSRMPPELRPIPRHLRTLDVYSRPNYALLYDCLEKIFTKCRASWSEPYDWETKDQAARYTAALLESRPAFMDPLPFFCEDPIRINIGPSKLQQSTPSSMQWCGEDLNTQLPSGRRLNSRKEMKSEKALVSRGRNTMRCAALSKTAPPKSRSIGSKGRLLTQM